jgi:hypothetical protein
LSAAETFRSKHPHIPVRILTTDPALPYAKPPLSKAYLCGREAKIDLPANDHPGGVGAAGGHPQDDGVREQTQGQRGLGAGNAQRDGECAAGQHEVPIRVVAAHRL